MAAGLGVTIYPESLIGYLGKSVAVRPINHPSFRSRTILASQRSNRSAAVRGFIEAAVAEKGAETAGDARESGPTP